MMEAALEKRSLLLERLADVDEEIADVFLAEEEPDLATLRAAIRRQTIALNFVPVFLGSAFKNKGVHPLLDGVVHYLPSPSDVTNVALDLNQEEAEVGAEHQQRRPARRPRLQARGDEIRVSFSFFSSSLFSSLVSNLVSTSRGHERNVPRPSLHTTGR